MAVVVGTFDDRTQAEDALARLRAAGFADHEMALVTRSEEVTVPAPDDPRRGDSAVPVATFATITGVIVGGAMFGPIGAIIGGITTGGGLGALLSTKGMTQDEAREYEAQLSAGRHVLSVAADGNEATAHDILTEAGATRIDAERPANVGHTG